MTSNEAAEIIQKLEPGARAVLDAWITPGGIGWLEASACVSIAISLRRIADIMELQQRRGDQGAR